MSDTTTTTEITEKELPASIKALWLRALSAYEMKNYNYTISLCAAVLNDVPGFVDSRKVARRAAVEATSGAKKKGNAVTSFLGGGFSKSKTEGLIKKDPINAMVEIEKALAKEPYNDDANDCLHEAALKAGMLKTAAFALETVRKGSPENAALLHKLGEFYMSQDDPATAAEVYSDILKHNPTDMSAAKLSKDATARASMKAQNLSEDSSFDDIKKDKAESEEMEKSEKRAMTRDQYKERLEGLMEKYREDQNDLKVVKEIGNIYEQLEYWSDAYVFYNWGYQLSNNDVTLQTKSIELKQRATDEEIKGLEAQLAADPGNPELQQQITELKSAGVAEALAIATERVEQNPTDPKARYELGLAHFNNNDFDAAIPNLQQAKKNPAIRTSVLLLLARSFDAKGMLDIAVSQIDDALADLHQMDAIKKDALYEKGLILSKLGQNEAALESFKEIYEVDYGYRDVAQKVEAAYGG